MMLTRRAFAGGFCCSCLSLALAGCTGNPKGRISAGYRPAANTDEAGLWQMLDRLEDDIKTSPARRSQGPAEPYLREIAERLAGQHAADLRVYLVDAPYFNASMAPNGMMQVWSGLLLRVENEAQLAAVIGHEIGHYLERHTLERWRRVRQSATAAQLMGMGLALGGGGAFAMLPQVAALAGIMAYSREQEREADAIGLDLMTKAGLAPAEAAQLWQNLIEENAADPHHKTPDIFFSTHPAPEERRNQLLRAAAGLAAGGDTGTDRYREQVHGLRPYLLEAEVSLRQPERSLLVIGRLRRHEPEDGQLAFYEAEVYRLRGGQADLDRALSLYAAAAAMPGAPAEVWRSSGLIHYRRGARERAAEAFRSYLDQRPDAPDADLIRSYLSAAAS